MDTGTQAPEVRYWATCRANVPRLGRWEYGPKLATKGWFTRPSSSTERGFSAWKAATEDSEGAWNLWVEETHYEKTKGFTMLWLRYCVPKNGMVNTK